MPDPIDKELYESVKNIVYKQYDKPSAYRSGALVKKYKEEFKKKYGDVEPYKSKGKEEKPLARWFKEEWQDVGNMEYPVYRPTKRVTKKTPLTLDEIDSKNLIKQSKLKQKIKGSQNLPPFKKKDK
jgi:hypothetical protein